MAAVPAGAAVREYVSGVVKERRSGTIAARDDVLGRLLGVTVGAETSGLDDATIGHTIAGIVSGSLEPGIGNFARVLDRFFDLPADQLATVTRAARTNDDVTLRRYVLEAMRFSPYPPYAWRYCTRDYMIAAGTSRERVIPAGALVVPILLGAMFDSEVVSNPNAFQPGRPDHEYLNFGHGLHECLGKMLGEMLIVEMARAVLALPGIRRAPGNPGHPKSGQSGAIPEGYYALHFTVQFDA
jgi:cytochrome P450